jgi:hypothetical protein
LPFDLAVLISRAGDSGELPRQSLACLSRFQVIVTVGGLLFNQIPQALGQCANDNDTQLVGAVLWALWCLTLSMRALGMAYLSRAAGKLGRGSWWRGRSTSQ